MADVSMSAAAVGLELLDDLHQHTADYPSTAKEAFLKLADVWADLETPCDQQQQELAGVLKAVRECWAGAVSSAHQQQQAVRDSIQQMLAEMMETKEALGAAADPAAEAELSRLQGSRCAHKTLRAWEEDVCLKAKYWQKQKLARLAEYEDLQARIGVLRRLCGLAPLAACVKPDISVTNMEFLQLELERLAVEKERREDLLRSLVDGLAGVCSDIGEDAKAAAAEVHPNLPLMWDKEASKVVRDMYKLSASYAASGGAPVDLSDSTISKLSSKLQAMKDLKSARATHAAEVLGVLHSLWDATAVPAEERGHFVKLMGGSLRLHARSLEKCQAEVRRLEGVQLQQMLDLINGRAQELRQLCADSHVAEPPGLSEALQEVNSGDRNPGAAADLLAKLFAMLGEVKVLTAKRAEIIAAIREVQGAVAEDAWLEDYENDEGRYKGRDANRKLQRAIKAKKLRERLPGLLGEVRARLAEWRESEGAPFTYDGRDYEFEVLDVLQSEVEEAAEARAAKAARSATARRQSVSGGGAPPAAAGLLSPAKGAAPHRASAGGAALPPRPGSAYGNVGSPGARRADGPSTPMPLRGVSSRTLSERHSICVVRSEREAAAAAAGGSAALSRSGEVRLRGTPTAGSKAAARTGFGSSGAAAGGPAGTAARRAAGTASASTTPRGSPISSSSSAGTPTRQQLRAALAAAADGGSTGAAARTPVAGRAGDAAAAAGLRASTSSKLDTIFRRSSVQHPVAKLGGAAADGSGSVDARTPGSDGKRGRVGRAAGSGPDQALAADQDRDA
ncbi:hypothetical protein OEZ86_014014 [Tetradesmus obliquus]|nr:hypothetical protein OEZ86_014014 [Tetradesmus obliquus]